MQQYEKDKDIKIDSAPWSELGFSKLNKGMDLAASQQDRAVLSLISEEIDTLKKQLRWAEIVHSGDLHTWEIKDESQAGILYYLKNRSFDDSMFPFELSKISNVPIYTAVGDILEQDFLLRQELIGHFSRAIQSKTPDTPEEAATRADFAIALKQHNLFDIEGRPFRYKRNPLGVEWSFEYRNGDHRQDYYFRFVKQGTPVLIYMLNLDHSSCYCNDREIPLLHSHVEAAKIAFTDLSAWTRSLIERGVTT